MVRCDLLPFAALVGLHLLLTRRISLVQGLLIGAGAAAASLSLSVALDSFFWRRWLWPEGTVLWFNTVMNKYALASPTCSLRFQTMWASQTASGTLYESIVLPVHPATLIGREFGYLELA